METMDRVAVSKVKKLFKQPLNFSGKEKIQNMDNLGIIQGHTIVETTLRFSSYRKGYKYG